MTIAYLSAPPELGKFTRFSYAPPSDSAESICPRRKGQVLMTRSTLRCCGGDRIPFHIAGAVRARPGATFHG
jgi:hypothetical protein